MLDLNKIEDVMTRIDDIEAILDPMVDDPDANILEAQELVMEYAKLVQIKAKYMMEKEGLI